MTPPEDLGSLFDRCQARLFRLACRMVDDREEARDLVQETFLRAARHPLAHKGGGPRAEAWLFRVLINLARDHYRRRGVRVQAAQGLETTLPQPPSDPEGRAIARDLVRTFLRTLGPRRRAVVALCELEQLDVKDAAALLRVSTVTVRWHLAAARRQLRTWRALHAPDRTFLP
jgi:RNA polymerase sigma factor (sigma-70 family)